MAKKVADQLVDTLEKAGVRRIYAVTGDSLNEVNEAVRKNGRLRWIHVRHEETGAYAAAAEAQLTDTWKILPFQSTFYYSKPFDSLQSIPCSFSPERLRQVQQKYWLLRRPQNACFVVLFILFSLLFRNDFCRIIIVTTLSETGGLFCDPTFFFRASFSHPERCAVSSRGKRPHPLSDSRWQRLAAHPQ